MWVTLKLSLEFNKVMFLGSFSGSLTVIQAVNLSRKFRSLQVRILVRKNNTDNKVFKRNFIQRNKKERNRKDKALQIFCTICGKHIWESVRETKFFEFEYFFFLFYRNVLKFIKFRVFFKVLFHRILGWIFFPLNFLGRTSLVDFHLYLFLGKLHSRCQWQNQSAGLSFRAFSSGPRIHTDSQIVVW